VLRVLVKRLTLSHGRQWVRETWMRFTELRSLNRALPMRRMQMGTSIWLQSLIALFTLSNLIRSASNSWSLSMIRSLRTVVNQFLKNWHLSRRSNCRQQPRSSTFLNKITIALESAMKVSFTLVGHLKPVAPWNRVKLIYKPQLREPLCSKACLPCSSAWRFALFGCSLTVLLPQND